MVYAMNVEVSHVVDFCNDTVGAGHAHAHAHGHGHGCEFDIFRKVWDGVGFCDNTVRVGHDGHGWVGLGYLLDRIVMVMEALSYATEYSMTVGCRCRFGN